MDGILPIRRAVLTALKASPVITALVPAARIYPQSPAAQPVWPFIRYGSPTATPITATCVDGAEIAVAIHGFAKPIVPAGGVITMSAEDHAAMIGAAVKQALHKRRVELDGGTLRIRWTGSQLLTDDEAEAYHHIGNYRVRLLA